MFGLRPNSPPMPPPKFLHTHWQVWVSLLWGHCSFLLAPGVHKVLFVPSKSLFPKSCRCSVINPSGLQSQIPWGFSVPLPDPQVGKSVVGPRTFLTVQECLWYYSAVCGSSAVSSSMVGLMAPSPRGLMPQAACPRSAAARGNVPVAGHC